MPAAAAAAKPDLRACAACRHQRRKCRPDCQWAEFFPAALPQTFANARALYGLRNMNELTRHLPPEPRRIAMETIIFESNMRAFDRVGGCYRVIRDLAAAVQLVECELRRAQQLLAMLRGSELGVGSNVENCNLGLPQRSSQDQEVSLRHYFIADDLGASTSSCRVDEPPGANPLPGHVCRSDQPLNFLDEQISSGTVPVMDGASSTYINQLELDPSSIASQLCPPGNKSLKTVECTNSWLLAGVYPRDQPSNFLKLKSLDKINRQSRPIVARDELDGR
ncbi:LOB domain-containing protein 4-like [Rhodamnia argentea]|uniref:LOB domain-containing protein 4-like n=1 Tax=Rhodamnia argentea TaxID=178133 RepID=A0A8B8R1T2_9MYRT|nr:LOB domain-containing protein 4-like [Rhodamnia argentea]